MKKALSLILAVMMLLSLMVPAYADDAQTATGKGIAVGGAVGFGIDWRVGVSTVGSFLLGSLLSRKVSVGSLCGAAAIAASSFLFHVSTPRLILSIFCACLAVARHIPNIKRLAAGTEPDFKAGSGKSKNQGNAE